MPDVLERKVKVVYKNQGLAHRTDSIQNGMVRHTGIFTVEENFIEFI